jgi:hypothetical protein
MLSGKPPAHVCGRTGRAENTTNKRCLMKGRFVAAALMAAIVIGWGWTAYGQNVTPESLGSSGLIMTGTDEDRRATGIGFFVEIPSQSFKGQSFIYLVTARHVLLDGSGRPLGRMSFVIGHGKGGAPVSSPLPSANEWFFDPHDRYADVAALPFSPKGVDFTTVPIQSVLEGSGAENLGADAYYVSLLSEDTESAPIMTVHFGRVSIADPVAGNVAGASSQRLCFLEGLSAPKLSGSPVYIRGADRVWLWGLIEAKSSLAAEGEGGGAGGIIGVLPAEKIAETVKAMAAAQDRRPAGSGL